MNGNGPADGRYGHLSVVSGGSLPDPFENEPVYEPDDDWFAGLRLEEAAALAADRGIRPATVRLGVLILWSYFENWDSTDIWTPHEVLAYSVRIGAVRDLARKHGLAGRTVYNSLIELEKHGYIHREDFSERIFWRRLPRLVRNNDIPE